jgi:hypothetical protein
MSIGRLRANIIALAKVSRLGKLPTFTTASVPDGPNGPLIPEIHENDPGAVYIPRTCQINAWDNPAWVDAIEKTGAPIENPIQPSDACTYKNYPLRLTTGVRNSHFLILLPLYGALPFSPSP